MVISPPKRSVIKKQICFTTRSACGELLKTHHGSRLDLTRTNAQRPQLLGEAAKGTVAADPNDPRRVVITELR